MKRTCWAVFISSVLLAGTAAGVDLRMACGNYPKTHVEAIDSSHATYSIDLGGKIDGPMTRDPIGYWSYDQFWEPNIRVTMANIGDTPVVNPWLQREGMPDTRTLKSIVDSIVKPGMSDKEKARRIWEFEINNRFHATTQDHEVDDVVKRVNAYGYSLCYNESKDISDLWRAAGLKVRKGYPNGHSLAEVYYDGAWHELDSDESTISLLRDNETIASEPEIVADHDLTKRTHTYGVLAPDNRLTDQLSASLLTYTGIRSGEQPSFTKHTMDFTLRPGESITRAWNPAGRFHAMQFPSQPGSTDPEQWNKRWRVAAHAMDGETTYSPDLSKASTLQYLRTDGVELRHPGQFGDGLYLTGSSGTVDVPVKTAYPIVGGNLEVDLARVDMFTQGPDASLPPPGQIAVSISLDGGQTWQHVRTSWQSDYDRMYVNLNSLFPQRSPARYEYILRFTLLSPSKTPVALKGFYLRSTLQMAPFAMPGLMLGENHFIFTDDSPSGTKVRITHEWNECDADLPIPAAPIAVAPGEGKTYSGTRVKFIWRPGSDINPGDYQFQLSEFPDMRWPLSPNFNKLISRTAYRGTPTFELPYIGLLNPRQKYYWRIRARSQDEIWGPWSKTYSFTTVAPVVPLDVQASFDRAARTVRLTWQPGKNGSSPARYRIYGSEEQGFTAHDHPYEYNDGDKGIQRAEANLLLETSNARESMTLPEDLWRPFYRVVAVDNKGRVSGPSAMAELSHPLIATDRLPAAVRSRFYQARIATSASIGDLAYPGKDQKGMKFRGGDDLVFQMTGAPAGLTIDQHGVISGNVGDPNENRYQVTVEVKDAKSGAGDSVQLPLAIAK